MGLEERDRWGGCRKVRPKDGTMLSKALEDTKEFVLENLAPRPHCRHARAYLGTGDADQALITCRRLLSSHLTQPAKFPIALKLMLSCPCH